MPIQHSLQQGIHCVDAAHMRDELASLYIIEADGEVALIETGTQHSLPNVRLALEQIGISKHQIKYVIPTHIHLDHAGGAGAMMQWFDQARLIVHPRGARHMIDPSKLIEGSMAVYGESAFRQLYGEIIPIDAQRVDIADDLDSYYLGKRELLFFDTPGHARHHFCIYDEWSRGVFSGDTFGLAYPPLKQHPRGLIPTSSPIHFDPEALVKSIDRILSYRPERVYLTHYGAIDEPQRRSHSLKQWIAEYVELCERIEPRDKAAEEVLEAEMREMIFAAFEDDPNLDRKRLAAVLDMDIELNAQGLAIWWRSTAKPSES